jgi:hypothetical protein
MSQVQAKFTCRCNWCGPLHESVQAVQVQALEALHVVLDTQLPAHTRGQAYVPGAAGS